VKNKHLCYLHIFCPVCFSNDTKVPKATRTKTATAAFWLFLQDTLGGPEKMLEYVNPIYYHCPPLLR